ncbi:CidA/LrgA family protein [Novosphingobium silvae]
MRFPRKRIATAPRALSYLSMLRAIFLLLACQLAGEGIHRLSGIALPGAVIGMVLLLCWLALFPRERPGLGAVTAWLTAHLAVMFVPAAVGLVDEGAVLSRYGVSLVIATTLSTVLTLVVTALVFRWALRRVASESEAP